MVELNLFLMSKSDLSLIEKAVQKNVEQFFSDQSSLFFIIGVSGGIDSMVLLHTFHKLGIPALVSHINYSKRGEASDKDAELVEQMSFQWGFECHTTTIDSVDFDGSNFQQWARELRYNVFRGLSHEYNASGIVVAHHKDDQIETILQKIFRGAGLASWGGMDIWNEGIFRPFLNVSRSQIEQYAQYKSIPYRTDESNLKSAFARNFLRNEWLQKMGDFFPGWRQNIERVSQQAENYGQALEWISHRITDRSGIDREAFHSLEESLQKALILHLLKKKDPSLQISHNSLDRIIELSELQTGKKIQLTETLSVLRDRERYVIKEKSTETPAEILLSRENLRNSPFESDDLIFSVEVYDKPDFKQALYLDADKISWPLTLRNWRHGDEFQPLGMEGHQMISDHLTNRKISAAYKNQTLVIESFEETICAVIFPPIKNRTQPGTISDHFKCDAGTKYCLKITYRS